jgi:hypothetical protein
MRDDDVQRVVDLLNLWPLDNSYGKLTWDRLIDHLAHGGRMWTRQALFAKKEIAEAFQRAKQLLRGSVGEKSPRGSADPEVPIDPAVDLLQRKLGNLRAENERLERLLRDYDERFIRYQYNAQRYGLSIGELARPLPPSPDPSIVAQRARERAAP